MERKKIFKILSTVKKQLKPQHAVQRLYELTKDQDTFITTEVGQTPNVGCAAL